MIKNILELKKFEELLKNSNKILLINHIRMDPDAFWSLWALYFVLEKLWKEVKAINDDETPKDFEFLADKKIIEPELDLEKFDADLIISLDAWWESQLWKTYENNKSYFDNRDFVVIDHHSTNNWYWSVNIIETQMSSACELVYEILKSFWLIEYITQKEATLLTAGIHTDTNIFYNQNTTSNTLRVAAELMDLWANFRAPIYNFFQKTSLEEIKFLWKFFDNLNYSDDKKIIYVKITTEIFKQTNSDPKTISPLIKKLISKIINIENCSVAFVIYDTWEETKASFRSKSFNVWEFCEKFWGWGHDLAAGFRIEQDLDEVEKLVLEELENKNI